MKRWQKKAARKTRARYGLYKASARLARFVASGGPEKLKRGIFDLVPILGIFLKDKKFERRYRKDVGLVAKDLVIGSPASKRERLLTELKYRPTPS